MTLLDPESDLLSLDVEAIDQAHRQFIKWVNGLHDADDARFAALFEALLAHTEQHFNEEKQLMERFGFPAIAEHDGEHQRVLTEFRQFKKRIDKGSIAFGRNFVREYLPAWFKLHVPTMDAALAAHVKARL